MENNAALIRLRLRIAKRNDLPLSLFDKVEGITEQEIEKSVSDLAQANRIQTPDFDPDKFLDAVFGKK